VTIQPFTRVQGRAAAIPEENVDTDIIFPARFLLITAREGLGRYAFHDRRFSADGGEIADFVLNRPDFRDAPVIVAGANFGSGSSREQAVWALLGQGIKAVIAPSFGEIFHANCLRNGILPVTLAESDVARLLAAASAGETFTIDLDAQTVTVDGLPALGVTIPPERKLALLNGWDETDQIIHQHGPDIAAFETKQRTLQPWLYAKETPA
jgi:3-isopropylmalate/(R)-2-methylmalate dehydratase small subunit